MDHELKYKLTSMNKEIFLFFSAYIIHTNKLYKAIDLILKKPHGYS